MAFTVEDFQDLLRLLDQHPEWRDELRQRLLTAELLQLPALVRELTERVDALAAAQVEWVNRITLMTGQITELVSEVKILTDRVGDHGGKLMEMDYARKYFAYFGGIARRLRALEGHVLVT